MDAFGIVLLVLIVLLLGNNQLTLWAIQRRVEAIELDTQDLGALLVELADDGEPVDWGFELSEMNGDSSWTN